MGSSSSCGNDCQAGHGCSPCRHRDVVETGCCVTKLETALEKSPFAQIRLDNDEACFALRLKATLASDRLRTLSREDAAGHRNTWQELVTEFAKQKAFWDGANAQYDGRHWGTVASIRSKLEFVIATDGANDADALLALEAMLHTSGAVKETARHQWGNTSYKARRRHCAPVLSPSAKRIAVDVVEQIQVRQARAELADYLDMFARADDGRFEARAREWLVVVVKACDVREGILKDLLNEMITADDARRKQHTLELEFFTVEPVQLHNT